LTGREHFAGSDLTVSDFWSWTFSDLRENTTRGLVAEFLVTRALGAREGVRIGWDSCDVRLPDGARVEVKSSSYLQSWPEKALSRPSYGPLYSRPWTAETDYGPLAFNADVYVFALQTAKEHDHFNVLDLDQWRFWVLIQGELRSVGSKPPAASQIDGTEPVLEALAPGQRSITHTSLLAVVKKLNAVDAASGGPTAPNRGPLSWKELAPAVREAVVRQKEHEGQAS
jgi:hypothetical protein